MAFRKDGMSFKRDADLLRLPNNPEIRSISITDDDRYVSVSTSRYPFIIILKRNEDTFERLPDLAFADLPTGGVTISRWNGRINNNYSLLSGMETIPFYKTNMRVGDVLDGTGSITPTLPNGPIVDLKMRILP
jgi:hypothetical protein